MATATVLDRKVELARMTYREVAMAREEANGVVAIPIGATEQHGPHLPLNTDAITAEVVTLQAARDAKVPVAPTIPYGNSRQNIGFPGTISIRPTVLIGFVKDICDSLYKHGFDKLVVVNGHGGNLQALTIALEEFHYETQAMTVLVKAWQLAEYPRPPEGDFGLQGHAGRPETDFMLAIQPEDVDKEAYVVSHPTVELGPFGSVAPSEYAPHDTAAAFMVSAWESTRFGHYGDPSRATAEYGRSVLEARATNLTKILQGIKSGQTRITTRTEPMPRH